MELTPQTISLTRALLTSQHPLELHSCLSSLHLNALLILYRLPIFLELSKERLIMQRLNALMLQTILFLRVKTQLLLR
jgi:hypothetical protein